MAGSSALGAKLGPRLAQVWQQTYLSTLGQTTGHKVSVGNLLAQQVLHGVATDLKGLPRTTIQSMAEAAKDDPVNGPLLAALAGTPDALAIVSQIADVFGIMGSAGQVGSNNLAPIVQGLIAKQPNLLLDAGTTAQLVARGIFGAQDGQRDAAAQGIDFMHFDALKEAAYSAPGLSELLQLLRRGLASEADVKAALERDGVLPSWIPYLLQLQGTLLGPADLAAAVLRGWITQAEGERMAAMTGTSKEQFQILVNNTGMPPGLMQLLEAFRRGIIDKPRLEHGIRTSDVRDEWIDVVEALRYTPPSAMAAIDAEVKGHLSEAQAKQIMDEAGIDPVNHDWLYKATGNPPGAGEMIELWNRGVVDQSRVEQALRQGHLADEYIPEMLALKRKIIPAGTLLQIQQTGALTRAQTVERLQELGYEAQDAGLMAAAGSRAKIALDWQNGKTSVVDQYQLGYIGADDSKSALETMGFEADEADAILSVADLARELSRQNTAISKVHTLYVGYRITGVSARTALTSLGVPASQLSTILDTWTIEREAAAKDLTEAQIVDAFGEGILTQDEAMAQLEQIGYPALSAWTLLSIKNKGPLPDKPTALSGTSPLGT